MSACVCGHAPEEHRDSHRECGGTFRYEGRDEPCQCSMYELDPEEPRDG